MTRPASPTTTATSSCRSTAIRGRSSRALRMRRSILDLPRERALPALAEEANRHGAEPDCKRPTMGFPPACIPTCFYILLTTDSFEEALTEIDQPRRRHRHHRGHPRRPRRRLLRGRRDPRPLARRASEPRRDREPARLALARRSAAGLDIPDLIATEQELEPEGEASTWDTTPRSLVTAATVAPKSGDLKRGGIAPRTIDARPSASSKGITKPAVFLHPPTRPLSAGPPTLG